MTMQAPDIFSRIVDAQATASGNFIRDGKYVLAIKKILYESRFSGLTWITEFVVVHAEPIPGMLQLGGEPCAAGTAGATQVEPNMVGEVVSFVSPVGNTKGQPNAAGDVKSFLIALTNTTEAAMNNEETKAKQDAFAKIQQEVQQTGAQLTPEQINQRIAEASPFAKSCQFLISPAQPLRGALIRCQTVRKTNQGRTNVANKGKILVKPTWLHEALEPTGVALRRGLIDAGLPLPPYTPPVVAPSAPAT